MMMLYLGLLCVASAVLGQLSPEELKPLLEGLSQPPSLEKRVPLMTDDDTVAPLIDLQVFAPPVVPKGPSCEVELLRHTFGDGSYNTPAVVAYTPPTAQGCGEVGDWGAISMNLSVFSIGTQYDRLGSIYLSHVEIWRTSSAEPTKTGTIWNTIKDVSHYTPLFAQPGQLMMDFSNIIAPELLLDGEFAVIITATFYPSTKKFRPAKSSDLIIPLSNGSPTVPNFFTLTTDAGATVSNVTLPDEAIEAYVEVYCSGNSAEEFWYLNTPDPFVHHFPSSTGIIGKGPFREVQVLINDRLAGVVWPSPVIFTGGITPSLWRPLTAYGAYDAPTYWIDITPFIPILLQRNSTHDVTLRVVGQGTNPSFNSNWFVSGAIHVRKGTSKTSGALQMYSAPPNKVITTGGASAENATVWTKVSTQRDLSVQSVLHTSEGTKVVRFHQTLNYVNKAKYIDEGWVQWGDQSTVGTSISTSNGVPVLRDAFEYDLSVYSNYSTYTTQFGGYGSTIDQTFTRALLSPVSPKKSIRSVQHAEGWINMDDWPGLRHAISGSGRTAQTFAYIDERGETYFRDLEAKNDGWVADRVWGTLKEANPPVPDNQIFGPEGGPGFRRAAS